MTVSAHNPSPSASPHRPSLLDDYSRIRAATEALCRSLAIEDYVVQSMPDASPTKWHLAHTAWFFETFLLRPHLQGYRGYRESSGELFNSYYQGAGPMQRRVERGLRSRPTVAETYAYRRCVDEHMRRLLELPMAEAVAALVRLGLEHEQQHQELILTDLKHVLSCNPEWPAYHPSPARAVHGDPPGERLRYRRHEGGLLAMGANESGFSFDNETPRHRVFVSPYELGTRAVTNAEFREFIRDRGYERPTLWLADGWTTVQTQGWSRPLYWQEDLDSVFSLQGLGALTALAPVVHLSYYEADAFARWAEARLPTEAEWETAVDGMPVTGNFVESGHLQPLRAPESSGRALRQMFGDVWEWTQSPYAPYPGFRPRDGVVGEYNGKFMANQFTLRGGSCASPGNHLRATYRNFFYPQARWQFSGLRLARDG